MNFAIMTPTNFETKEIDTKEPEICISGLVLKGVKKPHDCPAFGKQCTRSIRLARPWCPPRARAQRITHTAGISRNGRSRWQYDDGIIEKRDTIDRLERKLPRQDFAQMR